MSQPSSTQKGDALERRIHDFFVAELAAGRFFAKPECCKIRWKPKYFSRDRGREITFDVSIEMYMPGASQYSALLIVECKNYANPVPVDDAEEFFAKIQQVAAANAKGVIASTAAFQAGTRDYARAKGLGLLRYFDSRNCKWVLLRSPAIGGGVDRSEHTTEISIGLSDSDHQSEVFDFYMQSPTRETHSIWGFFEDLLLDGSFSPGQLRCLLNAKAKTIDLVPFLEKDELEGIAASTLDALAYSEGEVPLEAICTAENKRSGLTVQLGVSPTADLARRRVLGRITFDPSRIEVFRQDTPHPGRDRFTLAHELAHHLLDHGKHMGREYCQASDFSLERSPTVAGTNVARMEFQANYLAASLLLPKQNIVSEFRAIVRNLGLPNRGYGPLYVDSQPCNLQSFEAVVAHYTRRYGVSRTAAMIRLQALGLLKDARTDSDHSGPTSWLQGLACLNPAQDQ
jgi:hypothetical protein